MDSFLVALVCFVLFLFCTGFVHSLGVVMGCHLGSFSSSNVFRFEMSVHNVQIVCNKTHFLHFKVDSDTTNLMIFWDIITRIIDKQPRRDATIGYTIRALIRCGECVVDVVDDQSLMKMFELNTNRDDTISCHVKLTTHEMLNIVYPRDEGNDGDEDNEGVEGIESEADSESDTS